MPTPLESDGYVFQIDQPERIKRIKQDLPVKGFFTEPASIPDLHPPRIGLYFVGFARGQLDMIGIGVHTGTPSTLSARIKIKKVINIRTTRLSELFDDSDASRIIREHIEKQNNVSVNKNVVNNVILRNIVRLFPAIEARLSRLIDIVNGIDFGRDPEKAILFAQQQDALRAAVVGLGVGWVSFEDRWEADDYDDSTTYLDGFSSEDVVATEDDILAHDQRFFGEFLVDDEINVKTTSFTDGKTNILVTMANRNAMEDVLGVDLIYYNELEQSYCLVQYKRMDNKGSSYTYYPSSDGNYNSDMELMEQHTQTFNQHDCHALGENPNELYGNYRIFGSPFFFKFVYSIEFEPFKNKVVPGYYLAFDLWKSFVAECHVTGATIKANHKTLTKHIGPNVFCDLFKKGMIGSRLCSEDAVVETLAECLRANRSAVFAFKPSAIEVDAGPVWTESEG